MREQQNLQHLKKPEQLQILPDKDFGQVLKKALEIDKIEAIVPEALRRLQQKTLKPLDIYHLTFSPNNQALQNALLEYFESQPLAATQTLQIAGQQQGKSVEYLEDKSTSNKFALWCVWGEQTSSQPAIDSNKQSAKHQAAILWIKDLFRQQLVTPQPRESCSTTEDIEDNIRESSIGYDNPIGYLNEQLPILKINLPRYDFTAVDGCWQCICQVEYESQIISFTAQGNNKKLAKQKAAFGMLYQLQELGILE